MLYVLCALGNILGLFILLICFIFFSILGGHMESLCGKLQL